MKRVITILLLTLLLCSTSFPVFALPDNEVTVQIPVRMKAAFSQDGVPSTVDEYLWYYSVNNDTITPLVTGEIYFHSFNGIYYPISAATPAFGQMELLSYQISLLGSGDVVIALPASNVVYSKPMQDMSVTMGINILLNDQNVSFEKLYTEYVTSTVYEINYWFDVGDLRDYEYDPQRIELAFYRVNDIQYGDTLEIKVGKYGLTEFFDNDNVSIGFGLPFGAFVSNYEGVDVFGSWTDPDALFSQNVDNISNTLKFAIENTTSIYEKIFFSGYADYQLNSLLASSNVDYVQQGVVLNSKLDNIITSMNNTQANINGYRNALNQFSAAYVEALKTAETPEQGDYITTIYQIKQQELTNQAVINSTHALQRVIGQEDLDAVTELDQLEDSMFSELSLQKLEDTITYNTWFNLLDIYESMTYRSIFDFFLYDAALQYWIVIPMTFLIVSALLGTVIRVVSRPRRSSRGE